jgi:hypothetical protein
VPLINEVQPHCEVPHDNLRQTASCRCPRRSMMLRVQFPFSHVMAKYGRGTAALVLS